VKKSGKGVNRKLNGIEKGKLKRKNHDSVDGEDAPKPTKA
jgi:hypothetical protein